MKFSTITSVAATAAFFLSIGAQSIALEKPTSCSNLTESAASKLQRQSGTIINTTLVAATSSTPEYCKVIASIAYGKNDTLNFQVYLPAAHNWTGRFMAVGNGGFAGTIDTASMLTNLQAGFAVAGGDAGHLASLNTGATLPYMHDLDQVEAWIHNAISLFTPSAREIIKAFYGSPAKYSYYNGCSTGGAQGFALAQYHPNLFDGIYAGSPGNRYSRLMVSFMWNGIKTQGSSIIPTASLAAITAAVLAECDTIDGVADGMLEDPLKCPFDINTLSCANSNASTCLTAAQLAAAKAIYAGPSSSIDGSSLYPGYAPSSESQWGQQQGGGLAKQYAQPLMANLVFNNQSWNYFDFNFGSDVETVRDKAGRYIDEIGPDFSAFEEFGGKMIATQGWTDPLNAPTWPIEQLQSMEYVMDCDVSSFFKLFMVPGGGHCASANPNSPGTYLVNDALIEWVEKGKKPSSIKSIGENAAATAISRLLCPWPETAVYKSGDFNVSTSYSCSS